jgi:hypothetical protein
MALSILDGNQSATTLSTILSSGQHITAHTVVSLGTQAITDMRGAVSGSVVSISSIPSISGTVTANIGNSADLIGGGYTNLYSLGEDGSLFVSAEVTNLPSIPAGTNSIGVVTIGNSITVSALPAISGTVTANLSGTKSSDEGTTQLPTLPVQLVDLSEQIIGVASNPLPISGAVTIGAGTAQIGSVTASISGTVPVSISSVTVGNSVTIGYLPAISGTVTANTFAIQGTAVTTSNFTSTTASTVLASYNATREVLTIFNEGAGNLHICAGATCTTIAYQVRLSAGDYYEVPNHQTTITHSAVFATAGTARVTEVS